MICDKKTGELYRKTENGYIFRCQECHLLWGDMTAGCGISPGSFYDESYFNSKTNNKTGYKNYLWDENNHRNNAKRLLRMVSRRINLKEKRILDIGCAYGFLLDEAKKLQVSESVGVDVSRQACEYAKTVLHLDVYNCELIECKFESEYFDVVFLVGTLEHLMDPVGVLKEIGRVLKHHGMLVITTVNTLGLFRFYSLKLPEHIFYFNHINLATLLENLGYEVVGARLHYANYRLFDLFQRLYEFSRFGFFDYLSVVTKKNFSAASLFIPTNEMFVMGEKR